MRAGKAFLLLLFFLAAPPLTPPAGGETEPAVTPPVEKRETLSLEEYLNEAKAEGEKKGLFNGDVLRARAGLAEEKAHSSLHFNVTPGVRYYFGRSRPEGDIQANLGERFLEIPMNKVRQGIARDRLGVAESRRTRSISRFNRRAAKVFFDALEARSNLKLAEAGAALAEKTEAAWQHVDSDDPLVTAGREKAIAARDEARSAAEIAAALFRRQRDAVANLSGRDPDGRWALMDLPEYTFPSASLEDCLRWALAHRSDLLEGRGEIEAVEKALRLAGMDRWPRLQFQFGYNEFGAVEEESSSLYTHLVLNFPLWDGGVSKARSAGLTAEKQTIQTALEVLKGEIRTKVSEAWLILRGADRSYRAIKGDRLPAREFEEVKIRFEGGFLPALDFARARLSLAAHEAEVVKKNRRCFEAESALLDAMEAMREELHTPLPGPEEEER